MRCLQARPERNTDNSFIARLAFDLASGNDIAKIAGSRPLSQKCWYHRFRTRAAGGESNRKTTSPGGASHVRRRRGKLALASGLPGLIPAMMGVKSYRFH